MTRIWVDPRHDTPAFREMLRRKHPDAEIAGKMPPAGLASTEGLSPSSTESARTPGEHMKRDEQ